jgi:hypothetical protein
MPRSPSSPDLAASDFYLFPTLRSKIENIQVVNDDELLESLQDLSASIDQEELNRISQGWVQWVQEANEQWELR